MFKQRYRCVYILIFLIVLSVGCGHMNGNTGKIVHYSFPCQESSWIRDGEPFEFEGELWYPQDSYDVLRDSEVVLVGVYRDVQIFIERIDVRPYDRMYTKFGRNKFRIYKKHD